MLDLAKQTKHEVKLKAPFYAHGNHGQLHRYMETDFVGRYLQSLSRHDYHSLQDTAWQGEDLFGEHKDYPSLRLATHRTFYLFSCEANCIRLGEPALDPQSITSAGFVIRRVGGDQTYGWMIEDGEAIGWKSVESEQRDPDIYRRICRNGSLKTLSQEPSYSGEQIHPLHPTTIYDGNKRRHTILYGYLPLGGNYYLRKDAGNTDSPFEPADVAKLANEHYWPFGIRDRRNWQANDCHQVDEGRPSIAFYYLLRILVNRYHIGDESLQDNEMLEESLKQIYFYSFENLYNYGMPPYYFIYQPDSAYYYHLYITAMLSEFNDATRFFYVPYRQFSLYDYLQTCFQRQEANPLIPWLTVQDKKLEGAPGALPQMDKLPQNPSVSVSGTLNNHLYVSQGDAEELRTLLTERVRQVADSKAREIPISKFQQGTQDIYQVIPFVRHTDKEGREQITWGQQSPSIRFRVAGVLDPEASRPSLIPMPSLGDLRRGLAKGASFLVPEDTMALFNALKLNKGASEDVVGEPGPGLGIQWICSFSIPVITLVAMILLMIMISLLNIIFFWMPWVRICLPFPKIK